MQLLGSPAPPRASLAPAVGFRSSRAVRVSTVSGWAHSSIPAPSTRECSILAHLRLQESTQKRTAHTVPATSNRWPKDRSEPPDDTRETPGDTSGPPTEASEPPERNQRTTRRYETSGDTSETSGDTSEPKPETQARPRPVRSTDRSEIKAFSNPLLDCKVGLYLMQGNVQRNSSSTTKISFDSQTERVEEMLQANRPHVSSSLRVKYREVSTIAIHKPTAALCSGLSKRNRKGIEAIARRRNQVKIGKLPQDTTRKVPGLVKIDFFCIAERAIKPCRSSRSIPVRCKLDASRSPQCPRNKDQTQNKQTKTNKHTKQTNQTKTKQGKGHQNRDRVKRVKHPKPSAVELPHVANTITK